MQHGNLNIFLRYHLSIIQDRKKYYCIDKQLFLVLQKESLNKIQVVFKNTPFPGERDTTPSHNL